MKHIIQCKQLKSEQKYVHLLLQNALENSEIKSPILANPTSPSTIPHKRNEGTGKIQEKSGAQLHQAG